MPVDSRRRGSRGGTSVIAMNWEVPGYVADALIGAGGDGEVWRGRDSRTGDVVALKRVAPGSPRADRLVREAEALSRFTDPNVVRLIDVVQDLTGPVLVLEYAGGGSLTDLLRRRGRLTPAETVAALAPIADGLAHAHACGIAHGDVSPGNVLLRRDGSPVLADLGSASADGDRPSTTAGTDGFVDHRVRGGHPATPESDVFGLAAVAAWAMTGGLLGAEPDCADAFLRAARDAGIASAAVTAIVTGLRHDPETRPTAASMARALRTAEPAATLDLTVNVSSVALPVAQVPVTAGQKNGPDRFGAEVDGGRHRIGRAERPEGAARPTNAPRSERGPRDAWFRRRRALRPAGERAPRSPVVRGAGLAVIGLAIAVGGGLAWGANSSIEHPAPTSARTPTAKPADASQHAVPAPRKTQRAENTQQAPKQPEASSAAWTRIVEDLYARRAHAVSSADPTELAGLYTSDSEVGAADVARAKQMRAAGYRAEGFTPTVISVAPRGTATGAARVRVVDELPSYRLIADSTVVSVHPARPTRPWNLTLKRAGSGWKIATLEPAK